ncbi:MAG: preprotein translocase subunit YajC [Oscillospiraceae bacterium]|nr:preprotein translocase subunit YajC [Oscillospiraceae bacterium]
MLMMFLPIILIFYFLMIRPESKRKKEAEQLRKNLSVGDRITTIGGIVGTIVSIKDDKFVIETSADQVRIEFCKWALSTNDTAVEKANAEKKRIAEERAKAKAAKKNKAK